MSLSVRRLGPGDEGILEYLASHDADFDLEGRGEPRPFLSPEAARNYLANPAVLHWVAFADEAPIGTLYCIHLPMNSGLESELLLYEIGVHSRWRRYGIGRKLLAEMEAWMRQAGVIEVWVLADNPEAVDFYQACNFESAAEQPIYMTRDLL